MVRTDSQPSELFPVLGKILTSSQLADLSIKYAQAEIFDQALQLAQICEDNYDRARAFAEIANVYAKSRQVDRAFCTLDQALYEAHKVDNPANFSTILAQIAALYTLLKVADQADEFFNKAIKVAQSINDGSGKGDYELGLIVSQLIESSQYNQALRVIKTISSNEHKDKALAALVLAYIKEGIIDQAFQTATLTNNNWEKATLFAEIALNYAAIGQEETAFNIFTQTLEIVKLADDPDRILVEIAVKYAEAGRYDKAFEAVEAIEKPHYKADGLTGIANKAATTGHIGV